MYRVRQTVTAFDLGEESAGDEKPLLFNGGREHHIGPQDDGPAELAPAGVERRATPDAREPRAKRRQFYHCCGPRKGERE